jgi:hypothetical protein
VFSTAIILDGDFSSVPQNPATLQLATSYDLNVASAVDRWDQPGRGRLK